MCGRSKDIVQSRPIPPGWWPKKERIITIAEILPKGARGPSPTSGSPARGSYTGKINPQKYSFEGRWGLTFRRPRGLWKIDTPLLTGSHKISHAPGHRQRQSFERSLGQTHLLSPESLCERQEATGAHPGDADTGSRHFGELAVPRGHRC